ncbi:MAG: GGDEF and EAL domain-containing protein [Myxococcota bacterium]
MSHTVIACLAGGVAGPLKSAFSSLEGSGVAIALESDPRAALARAHSGDLDLLVVVASTSGAAAAWLSEPLRELAAPADGAPPRMVSVGLEPAGEGTSAPGPGGFRAHLTLTDASSAAAWLAAQAELGAAERTLRDYRERLDLLARGTRDGIWEWDVRRGVFETSARFNAIMDSAASTGSFPSRWLDRVDPSDRTALSAFLDVEGVRSGDPVAVEHRLQNEHGRPRWVMAHGAVLCDAAGRPRRFAGSLTDLDSQRERDALTGLPNRDVLRAHLGRAVAGIRRDDRRSFGLLVMGIDRYKKLSGSLGMAGAESLLATMSKRMLAMIRRGDVLARVDADELALVARDVGGTRNALRLARRLQRKLSEPVIVDGKEVYAPVSIGIAVSTAGYSSPDEIVRDATAALARVRGTGQPGVEIFDQAMHLAAVQDLQIESELQGGIERNELRLHYQPIISLKTGRLAGFEALARWEHPERGFISPGLFIPAAERTGTIVPLGRWAMEEACRQLAAWRAAYPEAANLFVSVNVSGIQLAQDDMLKVVKHALDLGGLPASALIIEVTESAVMDDADGAAVTLNRLREMGVGVAIDDFGTGHSSLSYLHRLPCTAVKVDREFVVTMERDHTFTAIVDTIVRLGASLGLRTVAEGVETAAQLRTLMDLGCEAVQGFLLARPAAAASWTDVLASPPDWLACARE